MAKCKVLILLIVIFVLLNVNACTSTQELSMNNGLKISHSGNGSQRIDVISEFPSCAHLVDTAESIMKSRDGHIVWYAQDQIITKECCLHLVPPGQPLLPQTVVRKVCMGYGETGWTVSRGLNYVMGGLQIYLPGFESKLEAYMKGLALMK